MAVLRRKGFVQIGDKIFNLRCIETIVINPNHEAIVVLSSGRTYEMDIEETIDLLALLGDVNDILAEADASWEARECDADEPLEGPEW